MFKIYSNFKKKITKTISSLEEKDNTYYALITFKEKSIELIKWVEDLNSEKTIIENRIFNNQNLEEDTIRNILEEIKATIHSDRVKVVFAIPHFHATARYIHLPSHDPKEINNMIDLQIPNILPYPSNEISSGYNIVEKTNDGFSYVNLLLIQKSAVEKYLSIAKSLSLEVYKVYLSIYGFEWLATLKGPSLEKEKLFVIINPSTIEILVMRDKKICLSRLIQSNTKDDFNQQLSKSILETISLFLRQSDSGPIRRVFLIGERNIVNDCKLALDKSMVIPVNIIDSPQEAEIGVKFKVCNLADFSLNGLGFALKLPDDSLDLIPDEDKALRTRNKKIKNIFKFMGVGCLIIVILFIGFLKNLSNKYSYISELDEKIAAVYGQAQGLEVMAQNLRIFELAKNDQRKVLEFSKSVHNLKPQDVTITEINFSSDQDIQFMITGIALKNDAVFSYVADLREEVVFSDNQIKVDYITTKATRDGDSIHFQLSIINKK